jgi:hypothetical protein
MYYSFLQQINETEKKRKDKKRKEKKRKDKKKKDKKKKECVIKFELI